MGSAELDLVPLPGAGNLADLREDQGMPTSFGTASSGLDGRPPSVVSYGASIEAAFAASRSPTRARASAGYGDLESEASSIFEARLGREAELLHDRGEADVQVDFHLLVARHLRLCLQKCSAVRAPGAKCTLDSWALGPTH